MPRDSSYCAPAPESLSESRSESLSESLAEPLIRVMYCRFPGPSARRGNPASAGLDQARWPECSPSRHALAAKVLARETSRSGQQLPAPVRARAEREFAHNKLELLPELRPKQPGQR
jgi:hypothetical protein